MMGEKLYRFRGGGGGGGGFVVLALLCDIPLVEVPSVMG